MEIVVVSVFNCYFVNKVRKKIILKIKEKNKMEKETERKLKLAHTDTYFKEECVFRVKHTCKRFSFI